MRSPRKGDKGRARAYRGAFRRIRELKPGSTSTTRGWEPVSGPSMQPRPFYLSMDLFCGE